RRCLIIANGFYEWSKEKKPYLFRFRDNRPFGMAGIYGKTPAAGGEKASFAIITTAANEIVAPVHDRMPVIIPAAACEEWLGNKPSSSQQLSRLLKPYPAELLGGCEVQLKKVSSRKTEKQLERK
ncbi:MAG TPA: SOS response-associated peptidase, partial [Smithellaceae bacterium]|nr:SOS response-associated peptidase [Smithellaceae bacterium]